MTKSSLIQLKFVKTIKIDRKKNTIRVYDLDTLTLLMGSSAVSGNLRLYGVTKIGNVWEVDIKKLKERLVVLEERFNKLDGTISIMRNVVNQI